MIAPRVMDFSNVVLSRRRKPYFRAGRHNCWYFKDAAGKVYRLDPNEERAFALWRAIMGPAPEPVVVPGTVQAPSPKPLRMQVSRQAAVRFRYDRQAPRAQLKTVRVLVLIDLLAGMRFPKSLKEIHELAEEATGQKWSQRTIERDLRIIDALGILEIGPHGFKINLHRSERLQTVALTLFPNQST